MVGWRNEVWTPQLSLSLARLRGEDMAAVRCRALDLSGSGLLEALFRAAP